MLEAPVKLIDISTKKFPNTFTMVDDEDFDFLNQWKWYPALLGYAHRAYPYVVRNSRPHEGKKRLIRMHTEILKTPKGFHGDHINGNRFDNRRSNLRVCLPIENWKNVSKFSHRLGKPLSSKYKGVDFRKDCKLYRAGIASDGVRYHIGYYKTPEEAAKAYNQAAIRLHGEFARLNEITD